MNDKIYSLLNKTRNNVENSEETPLSDKEVNLIMKRYRNENNAETKKVQKKHRFPAAAAVLAAAVVLVPTTVYAYTRINAKIEKTAPYQNTVKIQPVSEPKTEASAAEEPTEKPTKEQYMMYELGYLPDGYEWMGEDSPYGGKIHNMDTNGGITPVFYRIPAEGDFEVDLSNSASCENYESGDKTAMINYRISYNNGDESNFGRDIWIFFNDTRYLLELFITDDISQEDMYKIIDNVSLYETDEKCFGEYFPWLDKPSQAEIDAENEYLKSITQPVAEEDRVVLNIGDTADYAAHDGWGGYTVRVNSAELTDSFDEITTDACGWDADYSRYMDENGNILPNTRTWYKFGDGVYTLNEDMYSEDMPYHILKVNATYTNTRDEVFDIGISPDIIGFDSDGVPVGYETGEKIPPEFPNGCNYRDSLEKHDISGVFLSLSVFGDQKGDKNHVILESNETVDVEMCFLVPETRLGNMYFNFMTVGNGYSQSIKNGYPIFDFTALKAE